MAGHPEACATSAAHGGRAPNHGTFPGVHRNTGIAAGRTGQPGERGPRAPGFARRRFPVSRGGGRDVARPGRDVARRRFRCRAAAVAGSHNPVPVRVAPVRVAPVPRVPVRGPRVRAVAVPDLVRLPSPVSGGNGSQVPVSAWLRFPASRRWSSRCRGSGPRGGRVGLGDPRGPVPAVRGGRTGLGSDGRWRFAWPRFRWSVPIRVAWLRRSVVIRGGWFRGSAADSCGLVAAVGGDSWGLVPRVGGGFVWPGCGGRRRSARPGPDGRRRLGQAAVPAVAGGRAGPR
ncbi:hypothetical protein J2S44_005627 [Catenuloplanes niger]|uniref:Uncharacterized protein n=1 Tax=Catenuloplanes niger TaxID=587534 RepID=A0AAE4CVF8_9ACTN|nr:hypothetical protein [Catenuloplanes niger]